MFFKFFKITLKALKKQNLNFFFISYIKNLIQSFKFNVLFIINYKLINFFNLFKYLANLNNFIIQNNKQHFIFKTKRKRRLKRKVTKRIKSV